MTQPVVPSAVSYGDVQEGNDLYSASGQCTHSPPAGIETVRGRCLCQHRDGDGARMDGMANPGERSINIVTENKPKVLEGLGQKGTVAGTRTLPFLVMGITLPVDRARLTHSYVIETEHGNPVRLP